MNPPIHHDSWQLTELWRNVARGKAWAYPTIYKHIDPHRRHPHVARHRTPTLDEYKP